MHGGVVEDVFALGDAQEAGALLEGLRPQLRYLLQLFAVPEGAVFFPEGDDVFGCGRGEAGDAPQQGGRGGVDVHADGVDAVLHHRVQGGLQLLFGHVMLVLADADGLRLDLDQLGQRILKAAGDGDRGTEVHVELGKLLRAEGTGGVDRGPGLGDDHIAEIRPALVLLSDELDGHLLGLAAGGSVADGDVLHAVPADQGSQRPDGLVLLALAVGGIDDGRVEDAARAVDHRNLAAHPVAGIKAHGDLALDGRLHQQRTQVQRKLADGTLAGCRGEFRADLTLQRGKEQAVIGVERRGADEIHGPSARHDHRAVDRAHGGVVVQFDRNPQHLLLLPAVNGENLVSLQAGEILREVIIELIDRILFRGGFGMKLTDPAQKLLQRLAELGAVADLFGDDVGSAGQRVFHGLDTLFRIEVGRRGLRRIRTVAVLAEEQLGQGLETLLLRDGGAGAALLLIGAVEVFELGQGPGLADGGGELFRELSLLFDGGEDGLAAFLKVPKILQPGLQRAQDSVVHRTVQLLAVAGDEGDGVALVQQADDVFDVFGLLPELFGQN